MAEDLTPTPPEAPPPDQQPPFVLSDAKVVHVVKEGNDWVPAPESPARLQGTVGDTFPGIPAGQTGTYTSRPIEAVAGIVFRAGTKLITVVWEDMTVEQRRAFIPLLQKLLLKPPPVPVVAEEVVATTEGGGTGRQDDAVSDAGEITPPHGMPRPQELGGTGEEGDPPPQ